MPTLFAAVEGADAFACITARSLVGASMRRRSLAGAASLTGLGAACTAFGTGLAEVLGSILGWILGSILGSNGFPGCRSVVSGGTSPGAALALSGAGLSTIATAGF